MGKRELVALLSLSSWCFVMVVWPFLVVPWGYLQFVIVVFPDQTHLLFFSVYRAQYNRVGKDGKFLGSIYTKALYKEYTDDTFSVEKPANEHSLHLGILGPYIRANVGDIIKVVFKNMATRNYSIHAHGVRCNKTYEGTAYGNNAGDVLPGTTFTYLWEVPESSGPAPGGPNCMGYMYHSAVSPVKDIYSGLVGPLVICRAGFLGPNNHRTDAVAREFALLFLAFDENESWYIEQNILENGPIEDIDSEEFKESNKYDSINGLVYNNLQGLVMNRGENIVWYILGLGASEDIHTVHFHGQSFTYKTKQAHELDVIEVFPGTYETVEMHAENPGTWLLHCHVTEHARDGMIASYTIR